VYNDGLIHAGNLAYNSLLVLFPFFIVAATIAGIFGQTQDGARAVNAFFLAVPPDVAAVLRRPIHDVIHARTGSGIVWLGLAVAIWSSGSLIETIRGHFASRLWHHQHNAVLEAPPQLHRHCDGECLRHDDRLFRTGRHDGRGRIHPAPASLCGQCDEPDKRHPAGAAGGA
jgi:hypothetical protein